MSKPTAVTKDVHDLFSGTAFRVPDYQRSYAWDRRNWEDFWVDIKDGLESKTDHYWGTITLKSTGDYVNSPENDTSYRVSELVDGQQRTTTLYLFILALSRCGKPALRDNFIKSGPVYRLQLGSLNDEFMKALVDNPESVAGLTSEKNLASNKRLAGALTYFQNEIAAFGRVDELSRFVQRQTFMLEFVVDDNKLAVKAFESLNDRGKPLTLLEKTKSYLMFNSVRYLDSRLDKKINESFGEIFRCYDAMKDVGARAPIEYVNSSKFTEDELMRFFYHYFASFAIAQHKLGDAVWYDVDATTSDVFDDFIKAGCSFLRSDAKALEAFVTELVNAFVFFTESLRNVLLRTNEARCRELFCMLGVSAVIYPLLGALETRGYLDDEFIDVVEELDIRFYKIGGKSAKAGLYRYAVSALLPGASRDQILAAIRSTIDYHVPAGVFQTTLAGDLYNNPATKFILWKHSAQDTSDGVPAASIYSDLQVDHVFAQQPTVKFPAFGFDDEVAYKLDCHKFGNLILLEETLNKSASNQQPKTKAKHYQQSAMPLTRKLGFLLDNAQWKSTQLEKRTSELVEFCMSRWGTGAVPKTP